MPGRNENINSILVIQLARFGDFLQTTPLLSLLKNKYPHAELVAAVDSGQYKLALSNPHLDRVFDVDISGLSRVAQSSARLSDKIKSMDESLNVLAKRQFDLVINLNTSKIAALIAQISPAISRTGTLLGEDRNRLEFPAWSAFIMNMMSHRSLIRFNLVDLLMNHAGGGLNDEKALVYSISREDSTNALELIGSEPGQPVIGLQLGSRHESRRWPMEYFAELAHCLIKQHQAKLVLVGTLEENPLATYFMELLGAISSDNIKNVSNLMGKTDIPALGSVLSNLDFLVTTDTGSMHMAAAVKTRILGLFMGPAFCHETGPYGQNHIIIQARPNCSPCNEEFECTNQFCRNMITPDLALQVSNSILEPGKINLFNGLQVPKGVQVLKSGFDRFGLVFKPAVRTRGSWEEILAIAYREAGRSFMRPGYMARAAEISGFLNMFHFMQNDLKDEKIKSIKRLKDLLNRNSSKNFNKEAHRISSNHPDLEPLVRILIMPNIGLDLKFSFLKSMLFVFETFSTGLKMNGLVVDMTAEAGFPGREMAL